MLDVLLAEDDIDVRESVATALANEGHRVTEAGDGAQAAHLLSSRPFDLAICDVQMPKLTGTALLRLIRREAPGTAVVLMTSFANISDVIDSLRGGAVDYVQKPFDAEDFARKVVGPIAEQRALRRRFADARTHLGERALGSTLVTSSSAMRNLIDRVSILAHSDVSVLVTGDRGTGKELVAAQLHGRGPRREGPFVVVDCGLLGEMMLDAETTELTDADAPADGWFRAARGGTLVLDGIEKLSLAAQGRLLRIIDEPYAVAHQSSGWTPLGVRLVTLTRDDAARAAARCASGELLHALYYRLTGVQLRVPALRDRGGDLCGLVTQLLRELEPPARTLRDITPLAFQALERYAFPGNVRELRWALEHALALAECGPIDVAHLPDEVTTGQPAFAFECARVPR